jgi:steroid 5-alpha reductase family enzyme
VVVALAWLFCVYNGFLQGTYLFLSPDILHSDKDWLSQWRVRAGIALFFLGWIGNQHADYVLRHLRDKKPGDAKAVKDGSESSQKPAQRYHIPYGGLFTFTSAANYTGEIIEWGGFALAAWSIPALAFFLFTMLNLVPRGYSYHQWYKKEFKNYPAARKAVIPFIL